MTENEWRNKIDDYQTSIHAIVGFANFYVFDPVTRTDRDGVVVFQGRRLTKKRPIEEPKEEPEPPIEQPADPQTQRPPTSRPTARRRSNLLVQSWLRRRSA
jgi:hypothetical protein